MNERIKELLTPKLKEWGADSGDNFSEELEKFAELIVRECINKVNDVGYKASNDISADDTELFKSVLKTHFGWRDEDIR